MAAYNLWLPDSRIQRPESFHSPYSNPRRRQASIDYSDSMARSVIAYFLQQGEASYNIVVGKGNQIDNDNEFTGNAILSDINGGMYGSVGVSVTNRRGYYPAISGFPITIMVCGYRASSSDSVFAQFKANAATDGSTFALMADANGMNVWFYDITDDSIVTVGSSEDLGLGTFVCMVACFRDDLHATLAANGVLLQDYTHLNSIGFTNPIDNVHSQYVYSFDVPLEGAIFATSIHNREFSIEEIVAYSLSPARFIYEG